MGGFSGIYLIHSLYYNDFVSVYICVFLLMCSILHHPVITRREYGLKHRM